MLQIKIFNSLKSLLVDDEDYERINQFKWTLIEEHSRNKIKIISEQNDKLLHIGRVVLNYFGNLLVDHRDGNIFNNQKENLRLCTLQQNNCNRLGNFNISGYKGLRWKRNKWYVQISVNSHQIHLGTFTNREEAAKAYNIAALKYFGEFAFLNKIE